MLVRPRSRDAPAARSSASRASRVMGMSAVAVSMSLSLIAMPRCRASPATYGYFAASAGGAKEGVAQPGAHQQMRDAAAPGPLTQASAAKPPARPGREDTR